MFIDIELLDKSIFSCIVSEKKVHNAGIWVNNSLFLNTALFKP